MRAGCVYVLKNTVNDKKYVGQSVYSAKIRFGNHASAAKCGRNKRMPLVNAIRKYGRDAFVIDQEIDCASKEEMDALETRLIDELGTRQSGYNIQTGGNAQTEEDRKRMAEVIRSKWRDPVFRSRQSEAISRGQNCAEAKERMKKAQKIACNMPEARKRLSEQSKSFFANVQYRNQVTERLFTYSSDQQMREQWKKQAKEQWSDPRKRASIYGGLKRAATDRLKARWGSEKTEIILPCGESKIMMMYELSDFCREKGLVYGNALKAYRGEISHTKQYRFRRLVNGVSEIGSELL